jgi:hypothetical protein
VQEIYRLSDENRRFLHARLLPDRAARSLDAAEKIIRRFIAPSPIFNGQFRHAEIKRVIDQFEKATDDPAAVAELLLTDLSASLESFSQVGDFEPLVDHIYATLNRLEKALTAIVSNTPQAIHPPVERLSVLGRKWGAAFGWGVSDELSGMADAWEQRIGNQETK